MGRACSCAETFRLDLDIWIVSTFLFLESRLSHLLFWD